MSEMACMHGTIKREEIQVFCFGHIGEDRQLLKICFVNVVFGSEGAFGILGIHVSNSHNSVLYWKEGEEQKYIYSDYKNLFNLEAHRANKSKDELASLRYKMECKNKIALVLFILQKMQIKPAKYLKTDEEFWNTVVDMIKLLRENNRRDMQTHKKPLIIMKPLTRTIVLGYVFFILFFLFT